MLVIGSYGGGFTGGCSAFAGGVCSSCVFFFFQAEDGIRDLTVTGVQTCALPISVQGSVARSKQIHMNIDLGRGGARCPALLITSTASGQGKTTLTAALARLHARQGRRVRVFKCGPDFLDPHWHELASGAPVHSVDLWMTGEADMRARLHAAACEADLILVEGVMEIGRAHV